MEHFFIITNKLKDEDLQITRSIVDFFKRHKKNCAYQYLEALEEAGGSIEIDERTECILVIGGDGTLLKASRYALRYDIPLLGVNCGTLGFLTEVEREHLEEALTALLTDDPEIENRMMLTGSIYGASCGEEGQGEELQDYALNDIVLTRHGTLRILDFDLYVNGKYLNHYSADGVIVSTPTGSTGYSMSAGGPIIEPKAELLLITPICPHTLGTRSIILSAEDQVELRIPAGKGTQMQEVDVNFDGNYRGILRTGDGIRIGRAGKVAKFVRFSKVSFLEALQKKMSE